MPREFTERHKAEVESLARLFATSGQPLVLPRTLYSRLKAEGVNTQHMTPNPQMPILEGSFRVIR